MPHQDPEIYHTTPTPHCPNSTLPVLVYRNVLPSPITVDSITHFFAQNEWHKGGVFKHYPTAHFHSNTHECYAVLSGETEWVRAFDLQAVSFDNELIRSCLVPHTLNNKSMCRSTDYQNRGSLYGVGPLDSPSTAPGVTFSLSAGDIAVHAAGVAHRNVASSPDYEYVGVYPKGSPKWDNNFCKADPDTTKEITAKTEGVPVPEFDPVFGRGGPLVRLWGGGQK